MLTGVKEIVIPEFNERNPSSGKESEAEKSPRVEPNVAANPSDPHESDVGGVTAKPQSTTSSATSIQTISLIVAIPVLVSRAFV